MNKLKVKVKVFIIKAIQVTCCAYSKLFQSSIMSMLSQDCHPSRGDSISWKWLFSRSKSFDEAEESGEAQVGMMAQVAGMFISLMNDGMFTLPTKIGIASSKLASSDDFFGTGRLFKARCLAKYISLRSFWSETPS